MGWAFLASNGVSGNVLVIWDWRVVENLVECMGNFSVACHFRNVEDGFERALAGIYGPNVDSSRTLLWAVPWCVEGDFNVIRFPSEKLGDSSFILAEGVLEVYL